MEGNQESLKIGTYHSVDELDVTGALRVAVSRSVLGTRLVGWELGQTTVGVHLGEVESTVKTARRLETSTSKVNSWLRTLNSSYSVSLAMR